MPSPEPDTFDSLLSQLQDDPKPEAPLAVENYNERLVPDIIPDDVWLKVRNTLGLKPERWDAARIYAMNHILPKFGTTVTGVTAGVSMQMGFSTAEQMVDAIKFGREMMEAKEGRKDAIRIASGNMMAVVSDSLARMLAQVMAVAEKQCPQAAPPPPGGQFRNLPPLPPSQLNIQVNVGEPKTSPASEQGTKHLPPAIPVGSTIVTNGSGGDK